MTATIVAPASDRTRSDAGMALTLVELVAQLDGAYQAFLTTTPLKGSQRRLPLADLYRLVGPLSLLQMASRTGIHARQFSRWHLLGSVTECQADRIACAFDLHPGIVWPQWWG